MDIKEIALRIGEEADEYADAKLQSRGESHPDWHTVRDEYFAERLIAELAKQNKPVAYATTSEDGDMAMLFFDDGEARKYSGDDAPIKLYTITPTAEQIANETAEAIAKFVAFQRNDIPATGIEFANTIRQGEWRKFLKGE